jgi:hypothetical protein
MSNENNTILKQVADLLSALGGGKQPAQPVRQSAQPAPQYQPSVHHSAPPVRHDPRAWQQAKQSVVHIFDRTYLASQRIPLSYAGTTRTKTGAPALSFKLPGFDVVEVIIAPDFSFPHAPRILFARGLTAASSSFYLNNQLHQHVQH